MLEIKDLHVEVDGKEIIKGVSLAFQPGKVHVLMGPNGSGKSTLMLAIMGHPKYKITGGKILLNGEDITHEKPELRAKKGLFLSFQYPAEVNGVTISNFLRTAVNSKREKPYSVIEFHELLKRKMIELKMDSSFSKRDLNVGFSGGEKKRAEILQLMLLEPKYAILDEPDSGTDVDALKVISEEINVVKNDNTAIILITHYTRMLKYIKPDLVTILIDGKITRVGGAELAEEIDTFGYDSQINKEKG